MRFFFLLLTFAITLPAYAQEKFGTYENVYMEKTYEISISIDGAKYSLYIDALSLDKLVSEGGFRVEESEHSAFVQNLIDAKAKYEEWIATAKANNVTSLDKTISLQPVKITGYFYYGSKWYFDFNVKCTYDFKISELNGKVSYLLIVRSGKYQASSNEYIDCDGFVLTFTEPSEIDAFLAAISTQKISEFKSKPKTEDLFKD